MWGLVVVLTLSVVTAMARVSSSVVLVVLHDMLPVNLVVAWGVFVLALVSREWLLAVTPTRWPSATSLRIMRAAV